MFDRYEQQLILARMRVGSDMAVQIERAEAARRDDKKRHEELLDLKTREGQEREAALRQEMARAVEAAAAEGRAAAEKARAQIAQERSAWESALQEKVREECARREGEFLKRCDEQMRDELKVVITRMGAEKEEEIERRVSEETERVKQAEKRAEEALREKDELEMRLEKRIQSAVQVRLLRARAGEVQKSRSDKWYPTFSTCPSFHTRRLGSVGTAPPVKCDLPIDPLLEAEHLLQEVPLFALLEPHI
jgi:hypothetical protein